LLALRAGRAYDKNLPFCGAFPSSLKEVMAKARKCGPGVNGEEMHSRDSSSAKFADDGSEGLCRVEGRV
jgi:hypothetical protein